jgi:hypothetical protein
VAWGCQIRKVAAEPAARGRLHWLQVAEELLGRDGQGLNPDLRFDGTHMAPPYVDILASAVNRLPHPPA